MLETLNTTNKVDLTKFIFQIAAPKEKFSLFEIRDTRNNKLFAQGFKWAEILDVFLNSPAIENSPFGTFKLYGII